MNAASLDGAECKVSGKKQGTVKTRGRSQELLAAHAVCLSPNRPHISLTCRPESFGVLDHVTKGDLLNFFEDAHLRKSDIM